MKTATKAILDALITLLLVAANIALIFSFAAYVYYTGGIQ